MRITGGHYRGRKLFVPKGRAIRPTSDKVKQAVFNSLLQYDLPRGAQVLDLFCGTGALGIEALSRGADFCTFIDKNRESLQCCKQNIAALSLEAQGCVLGKDTSKIGRKPSDMIPANLVFIDPPYQKELVSAALASVLKQDWLAPRAFFVIECGKEEEISMPDSFSLVKSNIYGGTQIVFCRYGADPLSSTPL